MQKYYSISIPSPCHEDWNTMTPKEKGRYCDSCAKTVIDFTKMNPLEIQDFVQENSHTKICGHFKQTQLDSINIHIPSKVLEKQLGFQNLFLIALLIVMGTSLMNCTNKKGNKQKIDSIQVIDSVDNKTIHFLECLSEIKHIDSLPLKKCKSNLKTNEIIEPLVEGELIIETVGDIDYIEMPTTEIDSNKIPVPPIIEGELELTGSIEELEDDLIGFIVVENPPEFRDMPKSLTLDEKRNYFQKRISEIVSDNYNKQICSDLVGKQKIFTRFEIDTIGNIVNIQVRAPHPTLEKEAERVLKLLPKFIPARQQGKPIKMVYDLPIIFQIEE